MSDRQKTIGVLVAGHVPEEMTDRFGDYDAVFSRFLAEDGLAFKAYPVVDGVFPESTEEADAWLITGSKYGAYEDHAWIPPLENLIRQLHSARKPLVGVCFGHQIIAQALGGKVEKYEGGWIAGPVSYERADIDGALEMLAWHQDQVVEKPPEAEIAGSSDNCRFAILRYGDHILTYQAHPEFTCEFITDLKDARPGLLPEKMVENIAESDKVKSRSFLAAEIKSHLVGTPGGEADQASSKTRSSSARI